MKNEQQKNKHTEKKDFKISSNKQTNEIERKKNLYNNLWSRFPSGQQT